MRTLVIAENDGNNLKQSTKELVSAAFCIGGNTDILVTNRSAAKNASGIKGVSKVLLAELTKPEQILPENFSLFIAEIVNSYTHVLAASSDFGKNLLPRVAAISDCQQISGVSKIISHDTFEKPIYAGNAIATLRSSDKIKFITIRKSAFHEACFCGECAEIEETKPIRISSNSPVIMEKKPSQSTRPSIENARIVVAGGNGAATAEKFELIKQLADILGAAIGATRSVVDKGFAENSAQIGQSGQIIAPELYFGIGISGAMQHIAGIKDSKIIVAINSSADAPIFRYADYGIVANMEEITKKIMTLLKQ